jgi:thymidylate synthase (FAD)
MNCRELLHFFEERCCMRAQWEIRELANKMLEICKQQLPIVFANAGSKCIRLGYCPEGKGLSCGKYPLKEDVIEKTK